MSEGKNHSEQFERYLKGEMTPEEAYAFERKSLDDPFVQEAIEGFEESGLESLADLKSLRERISKEQKKKIPWLRIATAAILIITCSFIYFMVDRFDAESELAYDQTEEKSGSSQLQSDSIEIVKEREIEPDSKEFSKEGREVVKDEEKIENEENKQVLLADNIEVDELVESSAEVETAEPENIPVQEPNPTIAEANIPDQLDALEGENDFEVEAKTLVATEAVSNFKEVESDKKIENALQGRAAGLQVETTRAKKRSSSAGAVARSAQMVSETITGTVTDDSGEPLPGVTVLVKGTTNGVITDIDGIFQLDGADDEVLVVSFIGFNSQEVALNGRDSITISLDPNVDALEEVVVVGYGTTDQTEAPSYTPASPSSGKKEYKEYLEENLKYPQSAAENEIEGTVVLQLIISSTGSVENIEVKRSLGYGCDEEAIRLVNEGPSWSPAEKDGSNVADKVRVKVKFKL